MATAPLWGLFVGVLVIIHVGILKCCGFTIDQKFARHIAPTIECKEHNPVDTLASTDAKTYYSAPQESDLWQAENNF